MAIFNDEAVEGLRLKSTPEDIRSLTYTGNLKISDGDIVGISNDGRSCGDIADYGYIGIVTFQHIGKSGLSEDRKKEVYIKGDCLPVLVQGRVWVRTMEPVPNRGTGFSVIKTGVNAGKLTTALSDPNALGLNGIFSDTATTEGLTIVSLNDPSIAST